MSNARIDKIKINGSTYDLGVQPYSIQTVSVDPGDTILAHVSEDLDFETVNIILEELKVAFPDNYILIANEHILKGLTIIKPKTGTVNRQSIDDLQDWLAKNVEYAL